jgi:hypothetical protein
MKCGVLLNRSVLDGSGLIVMTLLLGENSGLEGGQALLVKLGRLRLGATVLTLSFEEHLRKYFAQQKSLHLWTTTVCCGPQKMFLCLNYHLNISVVSMSK